MNNDPDEELNILRRVYLVSIDKRTAQAKEIDELKRELMKAVGIIRLYVSKLTLDESERKFLDKYKCFL